MLNAIKSIVLNWQFWLRLMLAFLIPYILFGSIMKASETAINDSFDLEPHRARIALMGAENIPSALMDLFESETDISRVESRDDIIIAVEADSLDIGLVFPEGFYADSAFHKPLEAYYNSMQNGRSVDKVFDLIEEFEDEIVNGEMMKLDINPNILDPITVEETNTFNALVMLGKVMEQVKGVVSNVLNLIFILFVIWLTRNLVLRGEFVHKAAFGSNLVVIFGATMLAMAVVFVGFQSGLNIEGEGMVKGIIKSIQDLLIWNKLSAVLWLWWPTWLFIIGLMGCIASGSRRTFSAYSRTFWAAAIIHIVAVIGLIPIGEMGVGHACLPILNVFGIGQLAMQGTLEDSSVWLLSMIATTCWALVFNLIWYQIKKNNKKVE